MFKRAVAILMVAAVAGLVSILGLNIVAAQPTPSATRSFDTATVAPGGQVVVTIRATGYGSLGAVTEMLPEGFSYVSSSLTDVGEVTEVDDRTVRFTLQGADKSFTYTVTASETAGPHEFSGKLRNSDREDSDVGGDSQVTVEAAAEPSANATRSFDTATVAPGGEVVVTIRATGYGSLGAVTEMLPEGFSYVSSSLTDVGEVTEVDDRTVRFTLQGADKSFTYTVTASETAGPHEFSGKLRNSDREDSDVGGDSQVTVEAAAEPSANATRSFDTATVAPGGEVVVTIRATGYGSLGAVTEMLPEGFSYVSSSLTDVGEVTEVDDRTVRFTLQGADKSFTYTVTASETAGPHEFSGKLRNSDREDSDVGGDSQVTVEAAAEPSANATRSFDTATVAPGGEVVVTIRATGYGAFGGVTETLPVGFSYVSSSLTDEGEVTEVDDRTVRFALQGPVGPFTYTVTASSTVGTYTFMGTLRNEDRVDSPVRGVSSIRVGTVTPPDTGGGGFGGGGGVSNSAPVFREGAAAARTVAENAAPGTLVGDRVTAFDNDANTITYSFARNPDADSFTLDAQTGQIAVATGASLDFEVKNSYAVTVRASDRQGGADAIAVTIAVTNVDEAGAVSLSSEDPRIGTPLEAMLTDPDGGMADVSWQWERSPDQTSWAAVFGANAASYTPTEADAGQHLRVTVSYSDNHGAGKRAHRETANPVPDLAATPTPTAVPPTPTPTAAPPTTTPTSVPTVAPTSVPTVAPTAVPTAAPTAVPTAAPTAIPTVAPTAVPTVAPTAVPTAPPPATATSVAPVVVDEGGGLPIWLIVLLAIGVLVVIGTLVLLRFRVQ